jgi:aspartate-semialdehyde dehydrogenase
MRKFKPTIGLVGATGLVGQTILQVLKERNFPLAGLKLWASQRSAGKGVRFANKNYRVAALEKSRFLGCDLVFFAGTEGEKGASRLYSQKAIDAGAVVIDNGADYRMDPKVPLVVPEVNPEDTKKHRGMIANPNCSTIQMAVALGPIQKRYGIKRIVVSTYQSVSGAGRLGVAELEGQTKNSKFRTRNPIFSRQIAFNVIPQISDFSELGYSGEEWKMVRETHKIFHDSRIRINATAVRAPVRNGHSESIYFETSEKTSREAVEKLLQKTPGIVYLRNGFHTPLEIAGRSEVFVSRLRVDPFNPRAFVMWVVADNLRKGAATNAVQIAELLIKGGLP